jgi:hypothetical protein
MSKPLSILAAVIGVVCVIVAAVYCLTPANALPSFMPGYDPHLTKIHYTHGLGALVLGVGLLAYASSSNRQTPSALRD